MRVLYFVFLLFRIILIVVISVLIYPYVQSRHYQFPEPAPFTGNSIYNPYGEMSGKWLKANFHAHTRAWGGLTNGKQTSKEITDFYKGQLHYDIACISNYESIDPYLPVEDPRFIPVYEHGLNPFKTHQLVIGAKKPDYYEMMLGQSRDNKQYILERLSEQAPFVTLNHPTMRDSYSGSDLRYLSGYDLIEVFNNPRDAQEKWDAALSSGKLCWALGDDDTHDITRDYEVGKSWTMINATSDKAEDVYSALKRGSIYAAKGNGAVNAHQLTEVKVNGNDIMIRLDGKADEIRLIGQNGQTRKTVNATDSIAYTFVPEDSYIRAVIIYKDLTICLNPFLRYTSGELPVNKMTAVYAPVKTTLFRILFIGIWVLTWFLLFKPGRLFRKR